MKTRSRKKSVRKRSKPVTKKQAGSARRRAQLRAAASAYFEALAKKDMSSVPYDDDVILHAPLAPGGAANPIRGKEAVLSFFNAVLPALGEVKVLDHYTNTTMTRICTEAEVGVVNPQATLRVADCFTVNAKGRITVQENHYDPRPALPPSPEKGGPQDVST